MDKFGTQIIVCDEFRFIYSAIPKVACTSIKLTIADRMQFEVSAATVHDARWPTRHHLKQLARATDYFRFAFVRNPWDRLLSCYASKIRAFRGQSLRDRAFTNFKHADKFHSSMSFAEFVRVIAALPDDETEHHCVSQSRFVCHGDSLAIDFVGRFENIAADWRLVQSRTGLGMLPHVNNSCHGEYESEYNRELALLVARRYREDIERFGYCF